ncbi:MAG: hypothetical protein EBX50_22875, partial [Chitinophagia bacterium]|nr:hypothetical protein [Chitinophagia bacterium]
QIFFIDELQRYGRLFDLSSRNGNFLEIFLKIHHVSKSIEQNCFQVSVFKESSAVNKKRATHGLALKTKSKIF